MRVSEEDTSPASAERCQDDTEKSHPFGKGTHSSITWSWHLVSVKGTSLFIRQKEEKTDQSKNSAE